MPKVLHLLTALGHGGAEIWLLNMLKELDRRECEMDFCLKWAEAGKLEPQALKAGAKVYHVPLRPSHIGYLQGLARIVREGRYDIVHSHEFIYSGLGVWVARRLGVPVICTFHHWIYDPQTQLTRKPGIRHLRRAYGLLSVRYSLRRATYITTLSKKAMSMVKPDPVLAPNYRILSLSTTIPPPPSEQARLALRQAHGWSLGTPVVIHVGRFLEQKNHAGVLAVFERVRAELPAAKLLLLGTGTLLEQVQKMVCAKGLEEHVRYLGLRDDVQALMGASDVFLFPSLEEGFGLAALEANAAGIPVVGSDIGGLDEAVVHGETAQLHPVSDLDGMAQSVLHFLRDRSYATQVGMAGRVRAQKHYSHAAAAQKLRTLYAECLSNPAGSTAWTR